MGERLDRRLVAVMFTDVVGYTALIQADERLGVDKRNRYMSALERHHDAFGGTIVQRLGDGSMSMFPSSLDAVLAAIEIQRELAAQEVPVRIGLHVGEVIVEPERLTGIAVNIAARIESFAVPGGVSALQPPRQSRAAPRRSTPSRKASSTSTPTRRRGASSSTRREQRYRPRRSPKPPRLARGSRSRRPSISPGSPTAAA